MRWKLTVLNTAIEVKAKIQKASP